MYVGGSFYDFTYSSATSGTLSGSPGVTGAAYSLGPLQFPHENTFYSISPHHGVTGTTGYATSNAFYDFHTGDCFYNCDPYTGITAHAKPIVQASDRGYAGVGNIYAISGSASATYFKGSDLTGIDFFKVSRDPGSNGTLLDSYDFLYGKYRNYSSSSQPYACDSTHQGGMWLDTTSTAHAFKMCGRGSGGYSWQTVFTFP